MLAYLTLIFTCQLIGEAIVGSFGWPVPGPVLGMVLLFVFLLLRGHVPDGLSEASNGLLKSMSLLFVPAGTGVMMHFQLLGQSLLPIGAALVLSTVATIAVTALLMHLLTRHEP